MNIGEIMGTIIVLLMSLACFVAAAADAMNRKRRVAGLTRGFATYDSSRAPVEEGEDYRHSFTFVDSNGHTHRFGAYSFMGGPLHLGDRLPIAHSVDCTQFFVLSPRYLYRVPIQLALSGAILAGSAIIVYLAA